MVLNLSYFLLLIIEGCVGPTGAGQVCNGQNFSVRVPYETLEQCETASRRIMVPGGFQKHVRGVCMAVPNTAAPAAGAAAPAAPAPAK
ncbi:MAG: hypothetical protein ABI630_09565 [Betaproteobacteria bacterium]